MTRSTQPWFVRSASSTLLLHSPVEPMVSAVASRQRFTSSGWCGRSAGPRASSESGRDASPVLCTCMQAASNKGTPDRTQMRTHLGPVGCPHVLRGEPTVFRLVDRLHLVEAAEQADVREVLLAPE